MTEETREINSSIIREVRSKINSKRIGEPWVEKNQSLRSKKEVELEERWERKERRTKKKSKKEVTEEINLVPLKPRNLPKRREEKPEKRGKEKISNFKSRKRKRPWGKRHLKKRITPPL
jgi:hypothetical protein